jgi:putative nucleotidyltransferase with HDIG domain
VSAGGDAAARIEAALAASDRLIALRAGLPDGSSTAIWVVGGTIRDALLGRPIGDIDLATDGDPGELARRAARLLDGSRFELSDEFKTWRVSDAAGPGSVDIAALRGPSIEADLGLRDFTVNAIAVPLAGGEPIDPGAGIGDLERRLLRPAFDRTFEADPLRMLRAARLGAALSLELTPESRRLITASAGRVTEAAAERLFAELRGMIAGERPLRALELLDELELTPVVLPDLSALRGVRQSGNHHLDTHDHTIEVLRRWLEVERDLERYAGDAAPAVAAALAEPLADELSRRDGIRFAAILHDIGKPATRTEQSGFVGFRGHDQLGAEMVVELCRGLRTSRRFADYLAALTRHHLVLGFMTHERPLSRRRIWDYLARTGREALDVTMLTIADRLSAQGTGVPAEAIEAHLDLAREMLAEIVELERTGPPTPLLAGDEIRELLGVEGAEIGAAVRELAAAQFAGEAPDRAAAERHLLQWWERSAG